MEKKPIFALADCNSTGADKVPVNGLLLNKQTGGLLTPTTKTGILNTTKLKDITTNTFLFEPASFVNTCIAFNFSTSSGTLFALKSDGTIWAKGWNVDGEAGISGGMSNWTQINGFDGFKSLVNGVYNTHIIKSDGTVWAAGWNDTGALGVGPVFSVGFHQVTGITNPLKISAGNDHAVLEGSDGWLYGTGPKPWAGLGVSGYTDTFQKSAFNNGGQPLKTLQSCLTGSLAQKSDGTVYICGDNSGYSWGQATPSYSLSWYPATWLDNAKLIAFGTTTLYIVKSDGTVWRSGWNGNGDLGTNDKTTHLTTLTQLIGFDNPNKIVIDPFNSSFVFIEKSDGTVWGGGSNIYFTLSNTYIQIPMFSFPKSIKINNGTVYILTQQDELYGLGMNDYRQILNTGTINYTSFQLIPNP